MAKKELLVTVRIDGLRETLAALSKLPKDANNELRAASLEISKEISAAAKQAGTSEGSQAALVAKTVRRQRDRVPVVVAGGTKKLGRNKKPAYKLLFGSEFGANRYTQYRPHLGRGSYWFFKTIEDEQATIAKKWLDAADAIIRKFDGVG